MLKLILVLLFTANVAQAYTVEVSAEEQYPYVGAEVTVLIDIDTVVAQGNTGFCAAFFWVAFEGERLGLTGAARGWEDMEAPVACSDRWLPDSYGMPAEYDRMAYCLLEDRFFNSGPDTLREDPEVELTFELLADGNTSVAAGGWSVYEWDGPDCGAFAESGDMKRVPEPSLMLGLMVGLPVLVYWRQRGEKA